MTLDRRSGLLRSLTAALVSLASVAFVLLAPQSAAAQPNSMEGPLTPLAQSEVNKFRLLIDRTSMCDAYGAAIRGVAKSGAVTTNSPLGVALSRQHVGRPLCHTTGLNGTFLSWEQIPR